MQSTILYDSQCGLCRSLLAFIDRRDHANRFRCIPLDSSEAGQRLTHCGADCDTIHLFDAKGHHVRSTAVLRIAASLPCPWTYLRFLRFVPRGLRDAVYDFIAGRRTSFTR